MTPTDMLNFSNSHFFKRPRRFGNGTTCFTLAASFVVGSLLVPSAQARELKRSTAAILEEVVVTARKRQENAQEVPLLVSAFGADQLEALKVRDLQSLTTSMPNVSLDDTGTVRGFANFSIRGLGINSSIVSIDPSVGVFVDGVYMGMSAGMVFDVFDLERIEVLRGPQGTLFGRNVTGGAILMHTKKPGDTLEATVRAAIDGGGDGGNNKYLMGTIGGPFNKQFAGKITAYFNDDDGWFKNKYNDEDFGALEQKMTRLVGVWTPQEETELIVRLEHAETEGDGPAAQSHRNGYGVPGSPNSWNRETFDFSVNEPGFYDTEADFLSIEFNQGVDFGNGTITNIFGWRDANAQSLGDIDGQPISIFHAESWTEAEQFSNELRYSGLFADKVHVTTGLFYFTNDIDYHERRNLLGYITLLNAGVDTPYAIYDGGGYYSVDTWALFGSVDYDFTESLTFNFGLRYTEEEKEADITALTSNISVSTFAPPTPFAQPTCNLVEGPKCDTEFEDSESWSNVSPKIGMTYALTEESRIYAHWTRSFRSGGYNLRNTATPVDPIPAPYDQLSSNEIPGPFDEETVDNYEIGYKSESGRSRLNVAIFLNKIDDMQRELNFPGQAGVIQLVRNTADAEILGIEVDGVYAVTENLLINASIGILDAEYTDVKADLNGDGSIDKKDEDLDLPRAPESTYSVGVIHDLTLGSWGYMSSRLNYSYRNDSAYTDNNRGWLPELRILDAGIDFHTNDGHWIFGIYGKNLRDKVNFGGDTQLPDAIGPVPTGGTFAPLSKGKVVGAEVTYNYF